MTCLLCHKEIPNEIDQFGDLHNPMCSSCWLDGNGWVYEDAELTQMLMSGVELDDAVRAINEKHADELGTFEQAAQEIATAFLEATR